MSEQSAHQQTVIEETYKQNNSQKGDNHNEKIKISRQFCSDILRVR